MKTFYEIYECYMSAKKDLCKCIKFKTIVGIQKEFKCDYCCRIAALEFAFHWYYENNKTINNIINKVEVHMRASWCDGFLVGANIFSRKSIEKKERLRELFVCFLFFSFF